MSSNGRRYYVDSSSFLEPAELEFAEPAREARSTSPSPVATGILLEPAEFDFSEAVVPDPAVALRLTVQFAPGAEPSPCLGEFVSLLHALDDFDRALGGLGLVLDPALSSAEDASLTVVLRPLDARWSLDRFTQMAERLGVQTATRAVEQPPAHRNGEPIAEVISPYEQRGPVEPESSRDRVQNWRGRQRWLVGLQVELVKANAG